MLAAWYRSGGKNGRPLEGQEIIELAFALNKMPWEVVGCEPDETWLNKMLASRSARIQAATKK